MASSSRIFDDLHVIRIDIQRGRTGHGGRTTIRGVAAKDHQKLVVAPSASFHVSAEAQVIEDALEWAAKELRRLIDANRERQ